MKSLKHLFSVLTISALCLPALAQNPGATLFTYPNGKVTVEEFERYFLKNINFSNQPTNAEKVREDLDLYIKFKLKIKDAQDADKVFDMLMGTDVPARKSFIQSNAKLANLDI